MHVPPVQFGLVSGLVLKKIEPSLSKWCVFLKKWCVYNLNSHKIAILNEPGHLENIPQ
jgi:hypothetical protein